MEELRKKWQRSYHELPVFDLRRNFGWEFEGPSGPNGLPGFVNLVLFGPD